MIQLYTSRTSQIVQQIRHQRPMWIHTGTNHIGCQHLMQEYEKVSLQLSEQHVEQDRFMRKLCWCLIRINSDLPSTSTLNASAAGVTDTPFAHWTRFESYADVHPVIYWSGKQLYNVITHQPEKLGRLPSNESPNPIHHSSDVSVRLRWFI